MDRGNQPENNSPEASGSLTVPAHPDFWAKTFKDANGVERPGLSVRDHCLNVGCVAEALVAVLPPSVGALLPPTGPYAKERTSEDLSSHEY